jgi:nitrite reductase (NADH) small subunit
MDPSTGRPADTYILTEAHPDAWLELGSVERLPPGTTAHVDVDGKQLALFHTDSGVYAIDNDCLHMGGPMCEGKVSGTTVACPWHGWTYDLRNGERVDRRGSPTRAYRVEVRDGILLLEDK